jgi:hypothetical protein
MTISTKTRILKHIMEHRTDDLNIRDIATALKVDYKNCHDAITMLKEEGILRLERFGKANKVILIDTMTPELFEAEHERKVSIMKKEPNLQIALDYFERNLPTGFYVLLLFGSHTKGTAAKNSDIDLLFIVSNPSMEKDIHRAESMIPLKLHTLVFSEQEFIAMKNSRQDTVGSEAMKHNIILHGIESYYELIR